MCDEFDDSPKRDCMINLAICTGIVVSSLTGVGLIAGRTMLEKTLITLATPVGIVWLGLMACFWILLKSHRRVTAMLVGMCWVLLTAGGNMFVSNWLVGQLEQPFRQIDAMEGQRYDIGVVLGGGTVTLSNGNVHLNASGDRVMMAARLYHAGKLKRIVCTGTQTFRSFEADLDPREEAAQLLLDLDVPDEDIIRIEGNNTSEEMQNLRTWLESQSPETTAQPPTIGIITSAWHLQRALRLASANGIQADPLPSDFRSGSISPWPTWVIPGAQELASTSMAIKEYVAGLVGR